LAVVAVDASGGLEVAEPEPPIAPAVVPIPALADTPTDGDGGEEPFAAEDGACVGPPDVPLARGAAPTAALAPTCADTPAEGGGGDA